MSTNPNQQVYVEGTDIVVLSIEAMNFFLKGDEIQALNQIGVYKTCPE